MADYQSRINQLLELANRTMATKHSDRDGFSSYVNPELFFEFRMSSLSFILSMYGDKHPYYSDFNQKIVRPDPYDTEQGRGMLKSIKSEIDGGYLVTLKGIVSAEIFADFLEMAEHLLEQGYKDAAAVMIGSVLEEHLRQLCTKNGIALESFKSEKVIPKKADLLNSELSKESVYGKLDQKNVTAWLDLRNNAAHGKYHEYEKAQVVLMLQSVTDFMTRVKV